jgi:hypothetical protein
MNRRTRLLQFSAAMVLVMTSLVAVPADPADAVGIDRFVATTGSDNINDCSSSLTPCLTVGHAITESSNGDTIYVGAGTFTENLYTVKDLTFIGVGMDSTILDGGNAATVMYVDPAAIVHMERMTVRNGSSGSSAGGITNVGTLSLDQVRVTDNAGLGGGGIYSDGPLTVTDSVISWNTSTGGAGGGMFLQGAVTTTLTNVTLNGNSTSSMSGAIHQQGDGTLNLTNVTITGNNAVYSTLVLVAGSTLSSLNSTIAENTNSDPFSSAITVYGTATFKNTIVADNSPFNCLLGSGSIWTTQGNNMDSGTTCSFSAGGDQSSTNPQLAQLGNYGGYVSTMPLLGSSPAIDAGTNTGCALTDARGFTRPMNGPGPGGLVCDMGAVEMKEQTTTISPYGIAPSPSVVGQDTTVSAIVNGSSTTPAGTLEISSELLSCSPTLSGGFANCGMNFNTPGGRGILYRYLGDATHDASQAALYHIVNQASRTDFNNDGLADPAKYIPGTGTVWWRTTFSATWNGTYLGGDVAEYVRRSDFDGDGNTDAAKYVSGGQTIWYLSSFAGTWQGIYMGPGSYTILPGADFDRDGFTDPAKYVSADGAVWRLLSDTNSWVGTFIGFDAAPVLPGSDYDGDGKTDLAKYVPAAGAIWYLRSSDSTWEGIYIGSDGTPVPASDFDRDGTTDAAKYLTGSNTLWYRASSTGVWQGVYLGPGSFQYVPGADFDGDGSTDPAKFDTVGKGLWWLKSTTGSWDSVYMGGETYDVVN